jgi:hypothetical protein
MIPADWLKKIRRIELRTIRLVENMMAGQYHSVFKGRGLDFEEVREYQAGDDVRSIDWNVTARTGTTYIKQYVEEREMTVMLLVDASASGAIGSVHQSKRELAAELAAVLAFSAIHNNDKAASSCSPTSPNISRLPPKAAATCSLSSAKSSPSAPAGAAPTSPPPCAISATP